MKNRQIYNSYRNRLNNLMNKSRNNSIKQNICNNFNNPKKMWEIINRLSGKITKAVDEILIKSFGIKPNILRNKFAKDFDLNVKNVITHCNMPLLDKNLYSNSPNVSLRLNKIKEEILFKITQNIDDKKSPGYDKIRAKDLKSIANEITPALSHLINLCISKSMYPDQLKIGIIRLIHKKGCRSDTNNYRPITILSCMIKS